RRSRSNRGASEPASPQFGQRFCSIMFETGVVAIRSAISAGTRRRPGAQTLCSSQDPYRRASRANNAVAANSEGTDQRSSRASSVIQRQAVFERREQAILWSRSRREQAVVTKWRDVEIGITENDMKQRWLIGLALLASMQAEAQSFKFLKSIPVGGEGGWDYLSVDAKARKLYVAHATKIVIVDLTSDKVVGEI